jgi:hypothetical protein
MDLTLNDWLNRVYRNLGGPAPGAPLPDDPDVFTALQALKSFLPVLWAQSQVAEGTEDVWLVFLATRLGALDELLAIRSTEVDAWLGRALRLQQSEGFKNLFQLRGQWQKELDATRDRSVRRRQPVVGVMRRRSPIQPGLAALATGCWGYQGTAPALRSFERPLPRHSLGAVVAIPGTVKRDWIIREPDGRG